MSPVFVGVTAPIVRFTPADVDLFRGKQQLTGGVIGEQEEKILGEQHGPRLGPSGSLAQRAEAGRQVPEESSAVRG